MFGSNQLTMEMPDVVEGLILESGQGQFSVVVPEATQNLVPNPAPVLSTTGYTAVGGAIAQSTTKTRRNAYSLRVAPTASTSDGAYFGTVTTVTGWNTFSLDFWGYPNVPYKIYFATTGGALLGTATSFVGEGLWRRPVVKLYETSGTTRRIYFTKNNSADTNYFYVDGLQVEAKDHDTTYADGDMTGFVPGQVAYYWTGARYNSTSVRIEDTGSGGKIVYLTDYDFKLLGHTGLGMPEVNNIVFPYSLSDGEFYQTTKLPSRNFSIIGAISSTSKKDLDRKRNGLFQLFRPTRCTTRQPLIIRFQFCDEFGNYPSDVIFNLRCVYVGGLSTSATSHHQERVSIDFHSSDPYIYEEALDSAPLGIHRTLSTTGGVAKVNGIWQVLGTGFSQRVYCSAYDRQRNRVYFGGFFASANGVTVNCFTYWDAVANTFVALGGASPGVTKDTQGVKHMWIASNGDVWIVGDFTAAGGVATKGIARYNVATDTFTCFNITTTAFGRVEDLAPNSDGNLYFVGSFTDWNGDANQDGVTFYNIGTDTWSAVGTSQYANPIWPMCCTVDNNGYLYVGEDATGGGVTTAKIKRWNGSAWSDVITTDSAAQRYFLSLFTDTDGQMYIGGSFSTLTPTGLSAVSCPYIARYNGISVYPMISGNGVVPGGLVYKIFRTTLGLTAVGGTSVYVWTGNNWIPIDAVSAWTIRAASQDGAGNIYNVGGAGVLADFDVSDQTTVVNYGSEPTKPKIIFYGPSTRSYFGTIDWLENIRTSQYLYFGWNVKYGETVILDFDKQIYCYSDYTGTVRTQPIGGSGATTFTLNPGTNTINCMVLNNYIEMSAIIMWHRTHLSIMGDS